ncbi:MAG: tetratricopeptide repeat protein, partial [Candidatus Binatia bacterium]
MSEPSSRASVRFCPGCGEAAPRGANFCVSCGASLRAGRRGPAESTASGLRSQLPGLAVLATFLAVGLGLWVLVLRPAEPPGRLPLAPKSSPPPPTGTGSSQSSLPSDHPPIEIPAEVKTFIADLERKASESPRDVETWKNLAQVQYRAGQVDRQYLAKAEASFRRVLEIDPKNTDALRGIGNVHFDREEHGKAVESYSEYLKLKPGDANVRTDLGTMYL